MVAGISKRQQLRNERALQDLIRSVPGNDRCADCSAMNPGWASWNIGIFLCMRCAALHRKMGTHISKVKSLSMDSWASDQVDNMKCHGNILVNKIYNPRNVQPPVPTDIDESDACMERFIRQKYQTRTLEDGKPKPPSRHDPSYTRSPEGTPPPLPPKPARPFGFGLRSASSAVNLNRHSASSHGPDSPTSDTRRSSFDAKLAKLKEMGFTNERRNTTALRELDGNLDKTVETLRRLGEGRQIPQVRTPAATTTGMGASVNPFDQLDAKQPTQPAQPSQLNGSSYNPFDISTPQPQAPPQPQPIQSLEQSFQNLQVAQPLFPHSTGGYPHRQNSLPTYTQPLASPFAPSPAGFAASPQPLDNGNNPFFQTGVQAPAQPSLNTPPQNPYSTQTNPFFNQVPAPQPQTAFQTQNPAVSTGAGVGFPPTLQHASTMPSLSSSSSPFGQPSPFQQQPQSQAQQPQQPQPQLGLQASQPGQGQFNPFQPTMTAPNAQLSGYATQPPSQSPFGYQQSAQPFAPHPTGRVDKNSILALYSFSAPPPAIPEQQAVQQPQAVFGGVPAGQGQNQMANQAIAPQAVGSQNPFLGVATAPGAQNPAQVPTQPSMYGTNVNPYNPPANTGFMRGHMSQQSVDINGLQSGRHSPDAFASLSARYR
ncbi:putative GTPase activating protein for Arf [Aspergillus mulundensis]|uniref:Arf-GAP domain-containing protein n=1 Tax=Aspergillus mulundensis TaxID=1810919 RepID=A0A3D8S4V4_9EURO|nr:hypothetical protein DSM5745_04865 [Aspergillus mulundensis]RDW81308.1 hypothetical protein DSM5745_04865 [Aspergillus mulundensis]